MWTEGCDLPDRKRNEHIVGELQILRIIEFTDYRRKWKEHIDKTTPGSIRTKITSNVNQVEKKSTGRHLKLRSCYV
jgi:hypothetical protein